MIATINIPLIFIILLSSVVFANSQTCTDSDNSNNGYKEALLTKGVCTDKEGVHTDKKAEYTDNAVREYYCSTIIDGITNENQTCMWTEYVCNAEFGSNYIYDNGRCLEKTITCTDSID